jgi:hypothetical protein
MNNAVFGKTMQNVRNQMELQLTTDHKNAIQWFSKTNFKNNTHANGLYLNEMYKDKIVYDKPVYVGCAILDLSKLKMLEFHYEVRDKQFGAKAKLIYSDTDSLVYEIEHETIYEWQKENAEQWFDLSDSLRPELQSNENKKKLGYFKDELNSQILTEWLALNPKCYAFKYQSLKDDNAILEKKKAKGVSHVIVEKTLPFKVCKNTLDTDKTVRREITSIRSFNQELFSISTEKDCLTNYYDKLRMLNNIECEPCGFNNNEDPP